MKTNVDDSIVLALLSKNDSKDASAFLEDLLKLRRCGKTLISIKKKSVLKIIDSDKLSDLDNLILSKINSDMTYSNQVISEIEDFIFCYHSDYNKDIENPRLSIDIKNYINTNKPILESSVVLEDENDDLVYSVISKWFMENFSDMKNYHIHYEPEHGGGDRTNIRCNSLIIKKHNTFSICDSDKSTPHCPVGSTAIKAKKVFTDSNLENNFLLLNVHEVENLLPINLLIHKAREQQKPALEFIENVTKITPSAYLHYDFKEGFKFKDVYVTDGNIKNYWMPIYDSHPPTEAIKSKVRSGHLKNSSVIYNQLSSMLNHAIEDLHSFDTSKITPPILEEQWKLIGAQLYKWCLCSKPMQV
ncbi:hypothetical protein BCU50_007840 [Vibrio sp. 10N.286.46.E10]|uniref:hypothetical protein n=1 Tax=Vibrio sp. 10N.286.46.E10 TaxID=1884477 RepID=UPI000C850734|nr:hypothetical protein [Vibrio sp. 10N.286.46.E10]PMI20404.1 hypothetical protein BCU50_17715 [Vibrio sp. 10N.286.46.E10]